jgi:hypothetical protein
MSGSEESFHDPELKEAIVRIRGGHQVRPDLRATILQRLEEQRHELGASGSASGDGDAETAPVSEAVAPITPVAESIAEPEVTEPRMRLAGDAAELKSAQVAQTRETARGGGGGFRMPHWIAAAAVLLIVVGVSFTYWRHVKHEEEEREEYLAANRILLEAMIGAQEKPDASAGTAVAADVADPAAVSAELQGKLGRYVPVVRLAGWKLESAGTTQVAGAQGGRWRLSKGRRTLTVLSLPREAFKGEEGYDAYNFVLDKHAIAGYVRDGGIHCVVGDPSMTASESIALREELRRG